MIWRTLSTFAWLLPWFPIAVASGMTHCGSSIACESGLWLVISYPVWLLSGIVVAWFYRARGNEEIGIKFLKKTPRWSAGIILLLVIILEGVREFFGT